MPSSIGFAGLKYLIILYSLLDYRSLFTVSLLLGCNCANNMRNDLLNVGNYWDRHG